jgi:predicted DCC family thiol-disulfide oxidoreductase YuxK
LDHLEADGHVRIICGPVRDVNMRPLRNSRDWSSSGRIAVMNTWLVLYDGDCGFCKWLLAGILNWDRGARLQPLALQTERAAELLADLTPEQQLASWHLIAPTGEPHEAAPGAAAATDADAATAADDSEADSSSAEEASAAVAQRYSAGAALPPLLRLLPAGALPASALAAAPQLTERAYRWVAAHRSLLSKAIPAASKRRASAYVSRRESSLA